ncbi:MAG TPA: condensation domain-containing protein [Candidatus Limnocylindrales bacterium]|nr:condensation domain-containing protein [Candidatus Limnocylindrales bacterium]
MTGKIMIPFQGEGSDVEELTWSQRSIWEAMQAAKRSIVIGGVVAMPQESTVEQIGAILRFVMCRHQSLRTRLRFAPDGRPLQVVSPSGEVPLYVVDVADDQDPAAEAEAIRARQELGTFDYADEWPVWMTVVRHKGKVSHMVAMYSHLAVDGEGLAALAADLSNMDHPDGELGAPVEGIQPVALARQQRTPGAQRQSAAALRNWERVLRTVSPRRFGPCDDPQEPRFWEMICRSPALLHAVRAVAGRTNIDSGAVLLAAYAVAMARVTGLSPSVAHVVVHNRFRPGFGGSVSHLAQYAPVVIDVRNATFDEIVVQSWRAAIAANKHAYYDAAAYLELAARINGERGDRIDTACYFNDRRGESRHAAAGETSRQAILDALSYTERTWGSRFDWYDGIFFLQVDADPEAIAIAAWADTHHLAPADLETFTHHFETAVVEAALEPHALAFEGMPDVTDLPAASSYL